MVKDTGTEPLTFQETQIEYSAFRWGGVALTTSVARSEPGVTGELGRETHCSKSGGGEAGSYLQQQQYKLAVAVSVIGGFMVLVIVILAVGVLIAWRRKIKGEAKGKVDDSVELGEVAGAEAIKEEERRIA
jgi:tetrahydromethanopterin S-methyltransferase subunit E